MTPTRPFRLFLAPWLMSALTCHAQAQSIPVNGGFERTESLNQAFIESAAKANVTVSSRMAQVWQINYGAMAARKRPHSIRLIDDPARARSGRCALELRPGEVFLPSVPVQGSAKVTVRFWATKAASTMSGVLLAGNKVRNLYPPTKPVPGAEPDAKGYVEYVQEFQAPNDAVSLSLTLSAGDALVDDLSLDIEGTTISAPDLTRPAAPDDDTLAVAAGDADMAEGAVFTGKLIDGPFGKAYQLGPEDLLQLPGKFNALLRGGTIELWFRPHWPGRDRQLRRLITLSSDGFGYNLVRSAYNHVAFSASDGWGKGMGEVQAQHWQFANRWGAGDWHHVAVSWTPKAYWLFVDGCPVDTALHTTPRRVNRSWCSGRLPSRVPSLVGIGSPGMDVDEVRISRSARYWTVAGKSVPKVAEAPPAAAAKPQPKPAPPKPKPAKPPKTPTPAQPPRDKPQEFSVSCEDPQASDDHPGTSNKPFKTISRGVRELRPGDTLTARAGTYREGVEIDIQGTQEHPITVRAAPGETVVIKGSEVVKGWVRDGKVWRKSGWTKTFVHKHFAKGTRLVSPNVMEVFQRDGLRGDAVVLFRVRTPQELREGKCYWDEKTGTITMWPYETEGPFDPNANGVEIPVRGRGMSIRRAFVRVQGFQLRQLGMAAVTNWPSVSIGGKYCVLEDCLVTWADFGGISVSGIGTIVRRCEASYCGCTGFGAGVGKGMVIEDCVATHNNFWRYSPSWHGGGAKLIPWFDKSVVRRSRFAYNYGPGLWFDGSCNDSIIESCVCHDNEGPGIMVEISRGCTLRNNVCYNNRHPLPGVDLRPLPKKGYAPTACAAERVEGGGGGQGIFISSSPNTKVYNNLCYRNEGWGIFAEWAKRTSADVVDYETRERKDVFMSTHDVDVRNNILVNNGAGQLSIRRNRVDPDTYNNRSDYNLLFSSVGSPLVRWGFGGVAFTRLDKWQKASGFGTHSVVAAPLFEFSPGLDFRLQPDSAGVDQGQLLEEVRRDMRGLNRPLGRAADIGPFEIAGTRRQLERPSLPKVAKYFHVDLSKLVSRSFADEQADDGQGGWNDQGPTTDLRTFPTGRQVLNDVPFQVLSPKGCVVLKSLPRPQGKDLPSRVVIPIKRKADVLYFLHSGAWLGGGAHHWSYIILRGDGTSETIRVVGGENIRDWSDPNAAMPLDREYPTTTRVAWTGKNQTFAKVSVYMMAWVNSHTWCDVTSVEMVAGERGVPLLVAITGGLAQGDGN